MNSFAVLLICSLAALNFALPQWRNTQVDRFDQTGFKLSKDYSFNKGKSSLGGVGGYDRTKGIGLGLQGSHSFGQGTQVSGSVFKQQRGGVEKSLGLSHTFKSGTSVFGSANSAPNFKSKTFGVGHNFGQGTSLFGSQTRSNYGGFKVKSNNIGVSHQFKNGASVNAFGGKSSYGGSSFGLGVNIPFGKKK